MRKRLLPIVGLLLFVMVCWIAIAKAQSSNALPQAAKDACSDKDAGDVCSFVNNAGDSINGSCSYPSGVESKLICIPIH